MFAHTQSFVDFLKRLIMSAGVANTTKIPAHVDLSQPHTWVNCGLCLRSLSKCELGEIISFLELSNCKILNAQFQTGAYPSWSGPSMGDSGSGPQNPSCFRSVVVIMLASHARGPRRLAFICIKIVNLSLFPWPSDPVWVNKKQWTPGTNRETGNFGNSELHWVRPDEAVYT